jgi:guanylate kinase
MKQNKNRLIILSGPSCVGKSPLVKAFARFHPELAERLHPLVLYNSRTARPGETDGIDYHFRPRHEIAKLKELERFVVMDIRGDLQALDVKELTENLEKSDVLFEGNPFTGRKLQTHPALDGINRLSIFMSPVSLDEIQFLKTAQPAVSLPDFITDVMRHKLLRRTRKQKGELSLKDLENIETRASSAYRELQNAWHFQHIIPNHDGEDSENWDAFYYPLGDARKSLLAYVALLQGNASRYTEEWNEDIFLTTGNDMA